MTKIHKQNRFRAGLFIAKWAYLLSYELVYMLVVATELLFCKLYRGQNRLITNVLIPLYFLKRSMTALVALLPVDKSTIFRSEVSVSCKLKAV